MPLNFQQANAYYVWNRVINKEDGSVEQIDLSDPRAPRLRVRRDGERGSGLDQAAELDEEAVDDDGELRQRP